MWPSGSSKVVPCGLGADWSTWRGKPRWREKPRAKLTQMHALLLLLLSCSVV